MSTKDLIERLNRTTTTTRTTRAAPTTEKKTVEGKQVTKRVNNNVIRRRRADKKPEAPVSADSLPKSGGPVTAVRRPRKAAPAPAAEAPPVEAKAPAPAAEEAPKAPAKAPKAAKAAKAPEAEKPAEAAPTDAPAVEAAPEPTPAPEPPPQAKAEAPAAEAPAAEATAPAAPAEAAPAEAAPAEAAPAEAAAPADAPTLAQTLSASLPRADGSGPAVPGDGSFPGLGSAVVAPPPGYDPEDPTGNRRRAAEAARQSVRPAAPAGGRAATTGPDGKRVWRDEQSPGTRGSSRGPGGPGGPPRGKGRRGPGGKGRRGRVEMRMDRFPPPNKRRRRKGTSSGPKKESPQAKAIKRRIEVDGVITVANLAHEMSVKASQVIKSLMGMGQMATVNEILDFDTAQLVANEFEYEVINASFQEDAHMIDVVDDEEEANLEPRPPVVTIMGHVDHGKTTLLDTIRKADVVSGEAGGITQHIGAYQVQHQGQNITFIDTPGHAAFTAMRARGAQVTDIVVLVVAADDGVMPQTVEAINHSKAAGVQIIVAVNKIDKPGVDPSKIRQGLMEHGLVPEEYGGDTIFVDVSALKNKGIDSLLESIMLLAEVAEYQANPDRHANGAVLEARLERGRGPVATVLVQGGTLKQGDSLVLGEVWGRVRAMSDHKGKRIKVAPPSTPVEIIGLQEVPTAGDDFVVVESDKDAKALSEHRAELARQAALTKPTKVTLEDLLARANDEETLSLNLVVKADVGGSVEAIKQAFDKIQVEGTELKVLHAGVGAVTESDITLSRTYGAVIMAFNVRPDANARRALQQNEVEVRTYSVIYEAIEDVEKALRGLLGPTVKEISQGLIEIRKVFTGSRIGTIAGSMVIEGKVNRNHNVRLVRDGTIVWDGKLAGLKRFKDDVREVEKGYECGLSLEGYNDIKEGDQLEAYTREEVHEDGA